MYNFQIDQKTLGCVLVRKTTLAFAWHVDTVCMIIHVKYSRWGINSIKVYSKGVSNEKMYRGVFIHKIQYHITIKSELPKYDKLKWLRHYKMIELRNSELFYEAYSAQYSLNNNKCSNCWFCNNSLWVASKLNCWFVMAN